MNTMSQLPLQLISYGDEYTESELDEIRQFAEFVKNKRAK